VEAWLAARGIAPSAERVERILAHARAADHVLSDAELERLIDR